MEMDGLMSGIKNPLLRYGKNVHNQLAPSNDRLNFFADPALHSPASGAVARRRLSQIRLTPAIFVNDMAKAVF
jgi:hypothetical protein